MLIVIAHNESIGRMKGFCLLLCTNNLGDQRGIKFEKNIDSGNVGWLLALTVMKGDTSCQNPLAQQNV